MKPVKNAGMCRSPTYALDFEAIFVWVIEAVSPVASVS